MTEQKLREIEAFLTEKGAGIYAEMLRELWKEFGMLGRLALACFPRHKILEHLQEQYVAQEREAILRVAKTLHDEHCDTRERAAGVMSVMNAVRARGKP